MCTKNCVSRMSLGDQWSYLRQYIFCIVLLAFLEVATICNSLPVKQKDLPSIKELKYLQKYGYLDTPDPNSEALYKHEAVVMAIKRMQQFGALPQTGIMDNATKALLVKPRCGVEDVVKNKTLAHRSKRFVIATDGWKKRRLSYFLANWSPKLGSREIVLKELERAFKLWSDYSPLTFVHVEDPNADIVVAFGSSYHGDGYPFDGEGNTLAHAFFPYDFDAFGGDVHFDDDERWMVGPGDGTDFFTVSVHEIGHSLGLAHSYDPQSIMFPYYKGFKKDMALEYDDILGMYTLYIQSPKFEDEPYYPEEREEPKPPVQDDPDEKENTGEEEDRKKTDSDESESKGSAGSDDDSRKNPTVAPPPIPKPDTPKIIDICDGSYDTITLIRGEMFVFKDEYMWRFRERKMPEAGYPTKFRYMFNFPKTITKIDAAYENEIDGNIYFFSGRRVFIFDGYRFLDQSPRTLTDLGIQPYVNKLDAAFVWGKNGKTYFMSGSEYWRYNGTTKTMDPNFPHGMGRWKNVPYPVDTAMRWKDGVTYFFLGKKFYRFNDTKVQVVDKHPLPAPQYWFDCPDQIKLKQPNKYGGKY